MFGITHNVVSCLDQFLTLTRFELIDKVTSISTFPQNQHKHRTFCVQYWTNQRHDQLVTEVIDQI